MTTGEDPLPLLLDRAAQGVASFIALLLLLIASLPIERGRDCHTVQDTLSMSLLSEGCSYSY